MGIWQFFVIFVIGVMAGFVNTLAGGGVASYLAMCVIAMAVKLLV